MLPAPPPPPSPPHPLAAAKKMSGRPSLDAGCNTLPFCSITGQPLSSGYGLSPAQLAQLAPRAVPAHGGSNARAAGQDGGRSAPVQSIWASPRN